MGGVLFECHNITGRAISDMGIKMESTPWIPREIRVIIFLGVQKPVGGVVPMCIKVVGIPLPAGQCVYSLGFESRPSKDENNKNKRCFFHDIVVLKVIHESVFPTFLPARSVPLVDYLGSEPVDWLIFVFEFPVCNKQGCGFFRVYKEGDVVNVEAGREMQAVDILPVQFVVVAAVVAGDIDVVVVSFLCDRAECTACAGESRYGAGIAVRRQDGDISVE